MASRKTSARSAEGSKGKLRIGDTWSAISIIAQSQNDPLKAIAEFVENSIDARASNITIVRGKTKGQTYLTIIDDGEGIPRDAEGRPDFKYVATHICDSIKKRLKRDGVEGLQGEFGIGLLSYWTVGERLIMSSFSDDGTRFSMTMERGSQKYDISTKKMLVSDKGTSMTISPLLPGMRSLSGEKLQNYLASELRDRIKNSKVNIIIQDKTHRKQLTVKPREFTGTLIHDIHQSETFFGELYLEIYLNQQDKGNRIGLYRNGTRVKADLSLLDPFDGEPWTSGYLQGMIDIPFLNLTPGTRDGIIHDEKYQAAVDSLKELEEILARYVGVHREAEAEKANKNILRTVKKAIIEAFENLPQQEYDWMDVYKQRTAKVKRPGHSLTGSPADDDESDEAGKTGNDTGKSGEEGKGQIKFYEHPGPLFKVLISPRKCILQTADKINFQINGRDRKGIPVDDNLEIQWEIIEGEGSLSGDGSRVVEYTASSEPGICRIGVTVNRFDVTAYAEAVITVTDSILADEKSVSEKQNRENKGLPGYTFIKAPGELWRSRYNHDTNVIEINRTHVDFIFSSANKRRKLKYICRLYCKELVLDNFKGRDSEEMLERLVEISLYSEENL